MKKKKKQVLVAAVLLIALLIIGLIISFTNMFKSSYKVSDRTLKVREKSSEGYPVMGWVRVQGTNIDYPVLYAQDSNYSLNDVDISFAWTNSSSTTLNDRVILHGHNIRNVSSKPLLNEKEFNDFEHLPSFLYYSFVKQNKYIQYTINNKNYLYKLYAVSMMDESEFYYDENMDSKTKKAYIKESIEDSYFNFDIDVNSSDKLITLVTCTRFFGQKGTIIKLDARMVREDEKVINYKVSKNDSYKKIEDTMKGDENNEEA